MYGFVNTCTDVDYLHGSIEYWTITVQVLRTCARVATVVEVFNTRTEPALTVPMFNIRTELRCTRLSLYNWLKLVSDPILVEVGQGAVKVKVSSSLVRPFETKS